MAKKIPVKMAKEVCKKYNLDEVVILCRDKKNNQHIVTYGSTEEFCENAGKSGDMLKKVLAWPRDTLSRYSQDNKKSREEEGIPSGDYSEKDFN